MVYIIVQIIFNDINIKLKNDDMVRVHPSVITTSQTTLYFYLEKL